MKRTLLKIVILGFAAIILAPLALPDHCHVQRSIDIAASPEAAFAIVSDQSRQKEWSPWLQMDPATVTTVTGTGLDSVLTFDSPKAGAGTSTIISLNSPQSVVYHLKMTKPMPGEFFARMEISPTPNGCHLTWAYDQKMTYAMRAVGPFMEKMIGNPYQQGLENLKKLLETKA